MRRTLTRSGPRTRALGVLLVTTVLSGSLLTSPLLQAQAPARPTVLPYKPPELGTPEGKQDLNRLKSAVASNFRSDVEMTSEQRADLESYYHGYYFRGFTRPENFPELPQWRDALRLDFRRARNEANHAIFAEMTFNSMRALAEGNYYPAARVNAMLVIADLNSREATPTNRVPVPYGPALNYMRSQVQDAKQLDAVKIAALVGLHRHAEFQWQPDHPRIAQRDQLAAEMLALATEQEAPAGRDPVAHDWMRTRAIDILAALAFAGPNGEIYQALEKMVNTPENSRLMRCAAAYALGRLDYREVKADPTSAARGLGALAAEACHQEIDYLLAEEKRAKEKKEDEARNLGQGGMEAGYGGGDEEGDFGGPMGPGGIGIGGLPGDLGGGDGYDPAAGYGPGMGGMDGYGPASASTSLISEYKLDGSRRRLRYQLYCALRGIRGAGEQAKGISQLATAESATTFVEEVSQAVEDAMTVTDEKPLDKDSLIKDIRKKLAKLEELTADVAEAKPSSQPPADSTDSDDLPPDLPPGAAPALPPQSG